MRKNKNQRKEAAVSAVIGVILMVGITVAIAATVYATMGGMISATGDASPNMAFMKNRDSLTVSTVNGGYEWGDFTVTNDTVAVNLSALGLTGAVEAGDTIPNLRDCDVVITYQGRALIGRWTFD